MAGRESAARKPVAKASPRRARATSEAKTASAPLEAPPSKSRIKGSGRKSVTPRKKRASTLSTWRAPSEELKLKWGLRLLLGLLLLVALVSGEVSWTGDAIRIGLRQPVKASKKF